MEPNEMSAVEAAAQIASGRISSEELVRACLERIEAIEETLGAWTFLDAERALEQARKADEERAEGKALGPLHGVPVGIKDILDTSDMPTEYGTVLHSGHRPTYDASVVRQLREAGAVIMGKTVTTELAVYSPGKTRNPHNPEHTPGGSSSGSAAAVASYMVPLAVGTQTNGSVIRPASYCGVYGFKPSHGQISRHGILTQSPPLDQVGVFARSVEDAALISQQIMACDPNDPATRPQARPDLLGTATAEPPVTPLLAFVKSAVWDEAEDDTKDAFAELVKHLGEDVEEVDLPEILEKAVDWHRTIMEADLARSFAPQYERGKDKLSAILRGMIERGQTCLAVDYNRAVERIPLIRQVFDDVFERYDAIITPATTGEAPAGLDSTGSPIFCTLWTLAGMPAVSLPLLKGGKGLPMGVQLVGPKGDDARLLRTARWLADAAAGVIPTVIDIRWRGRR